MLLVSANPFSLCCALLICLPLALVFTSITTTTSSSSSYCVSRCRPLLTKQQVALPEDDDQLFMLASGVNPNPSPSNQPKRIAFMFLTTTQSLPFAPLWELFFHHSNGPTSKPLDDDSSRLFNIYIHADNHHNSSGGGGFTGVFSNRTIHSKPTQRFTPSLISAARRLLSHALIHDSRNAMFALLSPSCIPLRSFHFTYSTLIQQNGDQDQSKSFIEILKDEPGAYDRWLARGPMLPDVPFDDFRVGSQFFVLTRRHARLVVEDKRVWDTFNRPCVRQDVCYPEEHYFPTLINMRDPLGCVPATLTHVDWTGQSDGHPRTYLPSEVGPDLILRLKRAIPRYGGKAGLNYSLAHPFLFARKFSPQSLQPLLSITNDVIFRDKSFTLPNNSIVFSQLTK